VVQFNPDSDSHGDRDNAHAAGSGRISSAGSTFVFSVTSAAQQQGAANAAADQAGRSSDALFGSPVADLFFSLDVKSVALSLQAHRHSDSPADWFTDSWLADAWLANSGF
jgi:hypothetical protein